MTQFTLFAGVHINPAEVYKIDNVLETVTFTLRLPGMGAGTIYTEDFVFGSEAEALAAIAAFIEEAGNGGPLSRNEIICCTAEGVLGNPDITKGFQKTFGVSDAEKEIRVAKYIIAIADAIKTEADAP